jgi:hypothetical protein
MESQLALIYDFKDRARPSGQSDGEIRMLLELFEQFGDSDDSAEVKQFSTIIRDPGSRVDVIWEPEYGSALLLFHEECLCKIFLVGLDRWEIYVHSFFSLNHKHTVYENAATCESFSMCCGHVAVELVKPFKTLFRAALKRAQRRQAKC